jgi:hypothetical protein
VVVAAAAPLSIFKHMKAPPLLAAKRSAAGPELLQRGTTNHPPRLPGGM